MSFLATPPLRSALWTRAIRVLFALKAAPGVAPLVFIPTWNDAVSGTAVTVALPVTETVPRDA